MSSVKYTFEKAVNAQRLEKEIRDSSISTALDFITSTSSTVDIWFKASLSGADSSALSDLVTAHTNTPLPFEPEPTDSDGSRIFRPKVTKSGWHYEPRFINYQVGVYGSLNNRSLGGVDIGDAWLKFYNQAGTELVKDAEESDASFQARLDTDCVKTTMDWWPQYTWDAIGCIFKIMNVPTSEDLLWVLAAPDFPANLGGSVYLCNGGAPLNFFSEKETIYLNGRGSKIMEFIPGVPTNKLRAIVEHAVGSKSKILFVYEHYKG